MSNVIWIAVVAAVLLTVLWRVLAPSLDRAVARAMREKNAAPLVRTILEMSRAAQPNAFNHAIRRLWDAYERPVTVPLIMALAQHHGDSAIAQYWLAQVQNVEPELAQQDIGAEFLEAHFRPQVAASCGDAGG